MNTARSGTQGWAQLLAARKRLLDEYDIAVEQARSRKVKTEPGCRAEALTREWLQSFLPRRYGVTAGYIVSQSITDDRPIPHYDVIIYDALNAPVLWVENSPDASELGRVRAIPAEYVKAVFEVKSTLTPKHARDAIAKLRELEPLLQCDEPEERYRKFIPLGFMCAAIFFSLDNVRSVASLDALSPNPALRGYLGAVILRANVEDDPGTGRVQLIEGDTDLARPANSGTLLRGFMISEFHQSSNGKYRGAHLTWTQANFSMFAFDLVAILNGTFRMGYVSSFHALPFKQTQGE